jgi:hypothetical protein
MRIRVFVLGVIIFSFIACASAPPKPLTETELQKSQITAPNTSKDQALNSITKVMTSYGYAPISITPQLAVYEKAITSGTYQAVWGHGKRVRVSFTIFEDGKDIKIVGNIKGILSTNPGIAAGFSSGETVREIDHLQKSRDHLQELLAKISQEITLNSAVPRK